MIQHLASVTGPLGWGLILALLQFLACIGFGSLLLKKAFHEKRPGMLLSLTLGMNGAALLFFLTTVCGIHRFPAPLFWVLAFPGLRELCRFRFRKDDWFLLIPGALLLFLAGFAFVPPFGWDDTVYQLTVPLRWTRDGGAPVYEDLVYSAFPLMPQFLYRELILFSGVSSARIFSFLIFCSTVFSFRSFLPGRKAVIPAAVLLAAPIMLHMSSACYAETFLALNFLAAVKSWRNPFLSGIFGGFACGIKLNGVFPALAACIYGVLKRRDHAGKRVILYVSGMLPGLLFYLRPLFLTGNPFYPYLSQFLPGSNAAMRETAAFHHAIGGASFGTFSVLEILLAPVIMTLPGFERIYDGSWGLLMLLLFILAVLTLKNSIRRTLPGIVTLGTLYVPWVLLTPQTRFLLPAVMLCALFGTIGLDRFSGKLRKGIILLIFSAAVLLISGTGYVRNAFLCWRTFREPVNALYSLSGSSLVPEIDALRNLQGTTLLIGEERTLYFGEKVKIATPFFQPLYFTPPDDLTPETVMEIFLRSGAERILFRVPEDNPDLSQAYLKRSEKLFQSLLQLENNGKLFRKRILSDNSVLIYEKERITE